jgi:4-amino-4-deoxy-L-arabinose transferase-like glycosyltransferase
MTARLLARGRATLDRASDARLLVALGAVAVLIRVAYVLQIDDAEVARVLVGDATAYDAWARTIARGDWFGREVFYQAPLYPYFLAFVYVLAGPSVLAVRLAQAALGGVSCVLLAAAGRRFFSRGTGLAAGVVLAVYGPALFFVGLVHKMTLDLFFTTALLYGVARTDDEGGRRRAWLWGAGVALGCLALTRENALAWLPVVAAWLAWRERARPAAARAARVARTLGFFLGGVLFVLAPVAARNAVLGGVPLVTTSQLGVNFYLGNNADADGLYTPLRFGHGSFAQEREDAIEIAQRDRGRTLSPSEVSSYWLGRSWSWISSHPGAWLRLLARKWMLVWSASEIPDSDEPLVYQDASIILRVASLVSFGLLVPFAAAGVVAGLADRRRRPLVPAEPLLLALLLVSAASTAAFLVFARYRAPMVPPLALFAVVGARRLAGLARERPPRAALGVAAGALALAALLGRFPRVGEEHPRATAHYNTAVALEAQGQPARAVDAYRAALRDHPDFTEAHVNLGSLFARGGDLRGAIAEEREALRARPDDPTAHTILANALLQSGLLDEAETHYRAALATDPDFPLARAGLEALRDLRAHAPSR